MIASLAKFSSREDVYVPKNSLLHVKLDMPIYEREPKGHFEYISSLGSIRPLGLNQIVKSIENAAKDDHISGIYLEMGIIQAGLASVEEIRNALLNFRESGKPIIAYGDIVSQKSYYLASVSDNMYINPKGIIDFSGLSAQVAFFKGLSEKLKIDMQIIRPENNEFKSAVEPFYLDKMSEASKAQTSRYLSSGWGHIINGIGESRSMDNQDLNDVADNLSAFRPEKALQAGIVDGMIFQDQLLDSLRKIIGVDADDKVNMIKLARYIRAGRDIKGRDSETKGRRSDQIAVIYASGNIIMGDSEDNAISSDHISKTIRDARKNDRVKAIVLRINSTGGDGLASEVIWREVALAEQKKPVIVSMGDYAASGGYYIACAATKILTQPTTLTGSIGVFGVIPNLEEMMSEHLGITFDEVKTNKHSSYGSFLRPLSSHEEHVIKHYVDNFYTHFIQRVADGRKLPLDFVDSIAQGRIWSGIDAVDIGLADGLGGLNDAIKLAAEEAGIIEYSVLELPVQKDPFIKMLQELSGDVMLKREIKDKLGKNYHIIEILSAYNELQGVQARLPFILTIE